jgi:hypothetical protein
MSKPPKRVSYDRPWRTGAKRLDDKRLDKQIKKHVKQILTIRQTRDPNCTSNGPDSTTSAEVRATSADICATPSAPESNVSRMKQMRSSIKHLNALLKYKLQAAKAAESIEEVCHESRRLACVAHRSCKVCHTCDAPRVLLTVQA